ncbi:hypothetical protein B0T19DRAFT_274763 [Cercophora scortea]|uniref:Uncharacterized protein n=1 Tax=Cercophora scortea TaxID=314031 RepID=A0AAE0I7H1_9PEZI|nr:hypothetical protein B0T19DRAFT_274763 [Cercophora scortea]
MAWLAWRRRRRLPVARTASTTSSSSSTLPFATPNPQPLAPRRRRKQSKAPCPVRDLRSATPSFCPFPLVSPTSSIRPARRPDQTRTRPAGASLQKWAVCSACIIGMQQIPNRQIPTIIEHAPPPRRAGVRHHDDFHHLLPLLPSSVKLPKQAVAVAVARLISLSALGCRIPELARPPWTDRETIVIISIHTHQKNMRVPLYSTNLPSTCMHSKEPTDISNQLRVRGVLDPNKHAISIPPTSDLISQTPHRDRPTQTTNNNPPYQSPAPNSREHD